MSYFKNNAFAWRAGERRSLAAPCFLVWGKIELLQIETPLFGQRFFGMVDARSNKQICVVHVTFLGKREMQRSPFVSFILSLQTDGTVWGKIKMLPLKFS